MLEVNGISFQNIVHSDAANALRAQPCMVMKLKDVGKLPHSRITTYGKTEWYQSSQGTMNRLECCIRKIEFVSLTLYIYMIILGNYFIVIFLLVLSHTEAMIRPKNQ